jgi:hypothetical protein
MLSEAILLFLWTSGLLSWSILLGIALGRMARALGVRSARAHCMLANLSAKE